MARLGVARLGGCKYFSSQVPGFFELRQDVILPDEMPSYVAEHEQTAAHRQQLFPGWLGSWKTELGRIVFLHVTRLQSDYSIVV